ncbi:MAG TPA: superoxide dismutase [Nitrosopumilaceae archaeon]|nr:superoxide dismutase [Nitrosopumilaceae archaeon]
MGKYVVPPLNYSYDALEPYIDAKTMEIHHTKHHQAYANGLNAVLESINALTHQNYIVSVLSDLTAVPESARNAINFHGGGFENHRLFWENMKPNGGGEPGGRLADEISIYFDSFKKFKEEFSRGTISIQGSGWGWLVYNLTYSRLEFRTMPDQTSPWTQRLVPLLGLDVWEHAYYLKYQNRRADYVEAWWNVVNWNEVEERFARVST